jgi:CBS domain containing-hemolysin-like protein
MPPANPAHLPLWAYALETESEAGLDPQRAPIEVTIGLLAVLLLILAHGLFVAGEFGIVSVDPARIQHLADQGDKRAQSTLLAVKTLSFQLSGAQLGITLTSLIVGFLVEPTIGEVLQPAVEAAGVPTATAHGAAIALALTLATSLEMVLGELVPKNLAIAEPQAVAFKVATPLRTFNRALRWLIVFLNSSANWTVKRLGIEPREELTRVRSLEELQMMVRSSGAEGLLAEEDASLLVRSLAFGDKAAADALVPRTSMIALHQSDTLAEMTALALETGHSRFPVYGSDLDEIVGMAHVKDAYATPLEERATRPVTSAIRAAMFVPESRTLGSLLVQMRKERQHLAVVMDEYGGTAGVISLEDLLEEIVGEIEDEYDASQRETQLTAPPSGVFVVSGMLHPDEIAEQTGFEMPDGPFETLAGFLLTLLDRIPDQGDHTSYQGWELKVTQMHGRRIAQVLMVAPGAQGR